MDLRAQQPDTPIASHAAAVVDGLTLHYLEAGADRRGAAAWLRRDVPDVAPLEPRLAERFTVLAFDLPGIGESSIPADGLDTKTRGGRIHAPCGQLGRVRRGRRARHRADGRLRLRGPVPGGGRQARADGRVPARRRGLGADLRRPRRSGTSASTDRRRRRWSGAGSGSTSSTSGTTSPPTGRARSPRPIATPTPRRTRDRVGCAPGGPTSRLSSRRPPISQSSHERS